MIRITIELVPGGDTRRATVLDTINVSNECSHHINDSHPCTYEVESKLWDASGIVKHVRADGWRRLVSKAMAHISRSATKAAVAEDALNDPPPPCEHLSTDYTRTACLTCGEDLEENP